MDDREQVEEQQEGSGDAVDGESSVAEVFPADSVVARFVVSMSIAKNDIERALRDVMRAGENDDPDFSYRVRLVTGHLVEALDALNAYSQQHEEIRKLIARASREGRTRLKIARGTLQKAGPGVLEHVRDNTFHYPSPRTNYSPTSDAQLQQVLAVMGNRAEVHVDYESKEVTLTFADDAALALSMGKHASDRQDLMRQAEIARDGALAFIGWAQALVRAYLEAVGAEFGEPESI
jgi:hypothetical protein